MTLRNSGNFTCAHHVIHTGPSARTVLVDGGVPFTSATWVTAVVRFASDSVAADLRQRFPGLIPARPIVPMSSATDCGPVKTIYLPASAYSAERAGVLQVAAARYCPCRHLFCYRDANMPEPNFIAINPENGHGHCAAPVAMPVSRHAAAKSNLCINAGIARRIGADRHYSALITKIRCILSHDVQLLRQTMAFPGGRLRAGLADCRAPFFKSLLGVTIIAGSTGKELGGRSTTAAVSDRHCIPCDYPRRSVTIAGTAVSRVETGRRSFLC